MLDNEITSVHPVDGLICANIYALSPDNAPFLAPYRLSNVSGTFSNNSAQVIDGLLATSTTQVVPPYSLVAMFVTASNVSISDSYFYRFSAPGYIDCNTGDQCTPTFGSTTAGVYVDSGNVNVTNTLFSNFYGAAGGAMVDPQQNFLPANIRGGDVVGIYSGANSKIVVSDTTFSEFIGGESGLYMHNSSLTVCNAGVAILSEGPGPQLTLLQNVTGLSQIRICLYTISECNTYANFQNTHFIMDVTMLSPNLTPCLLFKNCGNSVLDSNGIYYVFPSTPIAISVLNSWNFTIMGLGFRGNSVKIEYSSAVTVTQCVFEGLASAAGVWASNSNLLVIQNNTFASNSGVSVNGNITNILVSDNLFTNTTLAQSVNASLAVIDAANFNVTRNRFVGAMSFEAIFANSSSDYPNSVGVVSDNVILGGSVAIGINVETTYRVTVERNVVSGVTGNCFSFLGISVTSPNVAFTTNVQLSDNVVKDFYSLCPSGFEAIAILNANIIEMNNNTISNFTVTTPSDSVKAVLFYGLVLMNTTGVIRNTTIQDLHLGTASQNFTSTPLLGVLHINGSEMDGLKIQNLSVSGTPFCTGCNYAPGTPIYGVFCEQNCTGRNIFMSDFTAGDSGQDLFPTEEDYRSPAGDAIGFFVPANFSISLNNAYFSNFKAGSSGQRFKDYNYTQCGGGKATYYLNGEIYYGVDPYPFSPPNVQQIEAFAMINGVSCLDSRFEIDTPSNISTTYTRNSFTITWSPPLDPLNPRDVTTYVVEMQSNVTSAWTTVYSEPDLSYTNSQVFGNTTYHVRLSAVRGSATSNFVYFIITTLPPTVPTTSAPFYKEFSVDSITLAWTLLDNGGLPITWFTFQVWNSSSNAWLSTSLSPSSTSYKKTGLQVNTPYIFRTSASNKLGTGQWSENVTISTAARACGDGNCDIGENCSTCYLDCGSCGYKPCPGTPECNSGKCESGVCDCPSGWSGPACEFSSTPIVVVVNDTSPSSTISAGGGGDGKPAGNAQFTIAFRDIQELNAYGDTIKSFDLSQQKYSALAGNITNSFNETSYNASLPNGAILIVHLFVVLQDSTFLFSNQSIHVSANSVKYSMEIWNWPFSAYNNKLKVTMDSKGGSQQPKDDCVGVTPQTDDGDNLLWIKVTVNGAVLYGKFSNSAEIDSVSKVVQFSYNYTSGLIQTIIPFFWNQAVFDPNFQVLFDPTGDSKCSSDLDKTKSAFTSGKIAGIVVGVVFGIAILVAIAGYILMRRRRSKSLQLLRSSSSDVPLDSR